MLYSKVSCYFTTNTFFKRPFHKHLLKYLCYLCFWIIIILLILLTETTYSVQQFVYLPIHLTKQHFKNNKNPLHLSTSGHERKIKLWRKGNGCCLTPPRSRLKHLFWLLGVLTAGASQLSHFWDFALDWRQLPCPNLHSS